MILEVCWDILWTLSFGLSQFHGHGSSLVCEVAVKFQNSQVDVHIFKTSLKSPHPYSCILRAALHHGP